MSEAKHTPGPWEIVPRTAPKGSLMIAAAPRMAAVLQSAARLLAELPESEQTPQMLALRTEIVATIKQATPGYYGGAA